MMNLGILVQGELTIISQDGKEKTVHEGEGVVEMVNTIHHGKNRGSKSVILYMFYTSQKVFLCLFNILKFHCNNTASNNKNRSYNMLNYMTCL